VLVLLEIFIFISSGGKRLWLGTSTAHLGSQHGREAKVNGCLPCHGVANLRADDIEPVHRRLGQRVGQRTVLLVCLECNVQEPINLEGVLDLTGRGERTCIRVNLDRRLRVLEVGLISKILEWPLDDFPRGQLQFGDEDHVSWITARLFRVALLGRWVGRHIGDRKPARGHEPVRNGFMDWLTSEIQARTG
jgi:hypothetical protein